MHETPEVIEIVSEEASVEKRDVVTGKVRVSTRTRTRSEPVAAVLNEEHVTVERVPINRDVDAAPEVRTEGDLTIIPVVEEVLVVEKRLVLREELHVRRTVSQHPVETEIALREQYAVIERQGGDIPPTKEDNPK